MEQYLAMRQCIDNLSVDLALNEGGSSDQVFYCSRQNGYTHGQNRQTCSQESVSKRQQNNRVLQA